MVGYISRYICLCNPVDMSVMAINFILISVVILRECKNRSNFGLPLFQNTNIFTVIVGIVKSAGVVFAIVGNAIYIFNGFRQSGIEHRFVVLKIKYLNLRRAYKLIKSLATSSTAFLTLVFVLFQSLPPILDNCGRTLPEPR